MDTRHGADEEYYRSPPTTSPSPGAGVAGDLGGRAERVLVSCGMILSVGYRAK